jgi:hypothetical protein
VLANLAICRFERSEVHAAPRQLTGPDQAAQALRDRRAAVDTTASDQQHVVDGNAPLSASSTAGPEAHALISMSGHRPLASRCDAAQLP